GLGEVMERRPRARMPPRPAAEQPGRLRPRAAWAGWASIASPLRLPRPRPDNTAAPAWRPREPGRRAWAAPPRVSVAAPAPQAYGGRRRQGGRRCLTMPGSKPPSKRQAPGGSRAPAPSAAGGPLWGNGARRAAERAGWSIKERVEQPTHRLE